MEAKKDQSLLRQALWFTIVASIAFGGGIAWMKQTPKDVLPKPQVAPATVAHLGLDGFDPVILLEQSRWQPGAPVYRCTFDSQTYQFASERELALFQQSPEKYAPVMGGRDVVVAADQQRPEFGSRSFGLVYEGRIYLFVDERSLIQFERAPQRYALNPTASGQTR